MDYSVAPARAPYFCGSEEGQTILNEVVVPLAVIIFIIYDMICLRCTCALHTLALQVLQSSDVTLQVLVVRNAE